MAKKVINLEAGTVSFDFTKDGGEVHVISAADVPGFVPGTVGAALHALLHGISQKVGDSYANAKNAADPVAWAQDQVKTLISSIKQGIWNAGRTGEGAVRVSLLARAMHRIKLAGGEESTELEAQAFVDSLTKEQVAEFKSKKKIAREMDKIRLEDAKAKLERAEKRAAAGLADEDDEDAE